MRSYSTLTGEGEEVVATEKIHGTNCRVGFVVDSTEPGVPHWRAGSKGMRRKEPATVEEKRANRYWFPLTLAEVEALPGGLFAKGHQRAVLYGLYGEVFGPGIQAYPYGQRAMAFRAFDLIVDDHYLNYDDFLALCASHGVAAAPEIYRGPFTPAAIRKGDSYLPGKAAAEDTTDL